MEHRRWRRIAYIFSPALARAADRLPSNRGRSTLSHALVGACGLLKESSLATAALTEGAAAGAAAAERAEDDAAAAAEVADRNDRAVVEDDARAVGQEAWRDAPPEAAGSETPTGGQAQDRAAPTAPPAEIVLVPSRRAGADELEVCHDRDFIDALLDDAANAAADHGADDAEQDLASSGRLRHTEGAPASTGSRGVKRKRGHKDRTPSSDTDASSDDAEADKYGLEDDCPRFAGLTDYVLEVCGGSLTAARCLLPSSSAEPSAASAASSDGDAAAFDVAIHLDGGRHHAGRGRASGFCYANDCNLAISLLRHVHAPASCSSGAWRADGQRRVMYIDLDLHHGDGVERSFRHSDAVLCVSVHRFDRGFFPNTGALTERGVGRGKGYTVNVPTRRGLSDDSLARIVEQTVLPAMQRYRPAAVVVQCGADGLHGDPHAEWNLSIRGLCSAVRTIDDAAAGMGCGRLYLGGGGYNLPLGARFNAALVATLARRELPDDIPEHRYWDVYRTSGHELAVDEVGQLVDDNVKDGYLDSVLAQCRNNLELIKPPE